MSEMIKKCFSIAGFKILETNLRLEWEKLQCDGITFPDLKIYEDIVVYKTSTGNDIVEIKNKKINIKKNHRRDTY